jgi:hypothetical protein
MNDVRIDEYGEQRCWSCGAEGFTVSRPRWIWLLLGPSALMTKKKLKCQSCGKYNDQPSNKVL